MGCIPVVSAACASDYRRLFASRLFAAGGAAPPAAGLGGTAAGPGEGLPALEDVVVVLPDAVFRDGRAVLAALAAIPPAEVQRRRAWLRRLAPVMQWGWGGGGADALTAMLGAALTAPPPAARAAAAAVGA